MVHLSEETFSELLDGGPVTGAEEHLTSCPSCRSELEALRQLRAELRELPELEPPAGLWWEIEARLPAGRKRRRLGWPTLVALQAGAMAAVFVLGLGLGGTFQSEGTTPDAALTQAPVEPPEATSLADAMAEVRRRGAEYNASLLNLERLAQQEGAPVPSLARQRLANLEMLVEASRTALSVEPADPVLNSYLFAALEERDAMMRQISGRQASGSDVMWR
jgi:hypothetical protein